MSFVPSTVVVHCRRANVTLHPDGTAYSKKRIETSALPPNGWITHRWGTYRLDGAVAIVSWTETRVDTFGHDGAFFGCPEVKAYNEEGLKQACEEEERVQLPAGISAEEQAKFATFIASDVPETG